MNKTISLKIDVSLFDNIKRVSALFNMSSSEFIRNAIIKELDSKSDDFIVRMTNVPFCDEEEENEIKEILNNLSDDDLKIVKTDTITL